MERLIFIESSWTARGFVRRNGRNSRLICLPLRITAHDEDGHRFQALLIVRHWIHGVIVMQLPGQASKKPLTC
jgi:hypothetical protein